MQVHSYQSPFGPENKSQIKCRQQNSGERLVLEEKLQKRGDNDKVTG